MGNELEVYLFSLKLSSEGHLQVQCFSQKWHHYISGSTIKICETTGTCIFFKYTTGLHLNSENDD
jgi:hypothetical protein